MDELEQKIKEACIEIQMEEFEKYESLSKNVVLSDEYRCKIQETFPFLAKDNSSN